MDSYRISLYPYIVIVLLFLKDALELIIPFIDGRHGREYFSYYPVLEAAPQVLATFIAISLVVVPLSLMKWTLIILCFYSMSWIIYQGRLVLYLDPYFHTLDLALNLIPPLLKIILLIIPSSYPSISILVPKDYDGDQPKSKSELSKELAVNNYPYMLLILFYSIRLFHILGNVYFSYNVNPWAPFAEMAPQVMALFFVILLKFYPLPAITYLIIVLALWGICFEVYILKDMHIFSHIFSKIFYHRYEYSSEKIMTNLQGLFMYILIIVLLVIPKTVQKFSLLRNKTWEELRPVSSNDSSPMSSPPFRQSSQVHVIRSPTAKSPNRSPKMNKSPV